MPRDGHICLTMDEENCKILDQIKKAENCKSRPETMRLLIREYKKNQKEVKP